MKQIVSNTAQVKSYNVEIVKNTLKGSSSGTKTSIAQITGLSIATCNTILNELAATGEIIELENEYSSVGRPAKTYRFNENYSYLCCIYMIYENKKKILNYAVVNLLGNVIKEQSVIKEYIDYEEIENLVQSLIEEYDNITAIGIGVPGVVNRQSVIDICDIEELSHCNLVERLFSKFEKEILIENDMNLIAYGFYKGMEYKEETSLAVVSFFKDNWPGTGIIVDGHIIHGKTNFAGEVSYLPFDCTHDEQKERLKERKGIIDIVTKTLCSLIAVINPETIVIIGTVISEKLLEEICNLSNEIIPVKHMPKILLENDIHKIYLSGLSSMTLEYLNNSIRKMQSKVTK